MHTERIELPTGAVLAVDVHGERDRPAVLLLHGGGQTRFAWGGTAAALAERVGLSVYNADMRGHGDSSWPGRYDLADFGADVVALLEHIGRPAALVGASLGGIASMLAAADHPAWVWAVVLVDITPRFDPGGAAKIIGFMGDFPDGFASLDEAADAVAAYLPHRPRPKSTDGLRKNLRRGEDGRYRWHWDPSMLISWQERFVNDGGDDPRVDMRVSAAARITSPTLLIRGRFSELVSEAHVAQFLEVVPHADTVDLAGARHMVAGDRNDAFTDEVVAYLDKIGATP